MSNSKSILALCAIVLGGLSPLQITPAAADTNNHAYVDARAGTNANSSSGCPVTAPCADVNTALSVLSPGGQVVILVGGVFGPIILNAPMSIIGTATPGETQFAGNSSGQVGCIGALPGSGTCL